jgi:hypothetical protein
LFAQVLIAVSFVLASYYDIKERAVYDLVWLPAIAGAAYAVYSAYPDLAFPVLKLALVGGIALAFLLYGGIGQADAIALALIAADPYRVPLVFPLIGAAVVALAHTAYEFAVGNARGVLTIPMEKFLREQRWIPKAVIYNGVRKEVGRDVNTARDEVEANYKPGTSVEVTYGVPTVAYLGIGYVAYLVCLLLFNQAAFFSLP